MRRVLIAFVLVLVGLSTAPSAQAAAGVFERVWGRDVITGGGAGPEVCTVAANCKGAPSGSPDGGTFADPADIDVGPDGNVYVADALYARVQVFTQSGTFLRAWGWGVNPSQPDAFGICTVAASCLSGDGNYQPKGGALNEPRGIAVGPTNGHVYVSESRGNRISEFTASGDFVRLFAVRVNDAVAGDGFEICPAAQAASCTLGLAGGSTGRYGGGLNYPQGIDIDSQGNLYVADFYNYRVQSFTADGQWRFLWGQGVYNSLTPPDGNRNRCAVEAMCKEASQSGEGTGFTYPSGIAVGTGDKVYVYDNLRVSRYSSSGAFERTWGAGVRGQAGPDVCTVAADCSAGGFGQGGGEFSEGSNGIAADASGAVYVSDQERIQRFTADGGFQAAWGRSVDAAKPTAFGLCLIAADCAGGTMGGLGGELASNAGLGTDVAGALYVGDMGNQRITKYAPGDITVTPPGAPTITSVSTTAPASTTQPVVTGASGAGTTVRLYDNPACTGTPLATGSAATFASPGLTITVATDATITIYATASNANGTSPCSTSTVTYTEESGPAITQVHFSAATASTPESTSGAVLTVLRTGDLTRTTSVKWATVAGTAKPFAAVGSGDFVGDGGTLTFAPGETSKTLVVAIIGDGLVEGDEAFTVVLSQPGARVAIDAPSSVAVTIVDDDVIDTTITGGPDGATNVNTPTFTFTATPAPGATFACRLDQQAPKPCNGGTFSPGRIDDGDHVFTVTATSPEGEADRSPATRSFFVDTAAPQAFVNFSGALSSSTTKTFAGEAGVNAYANDYFPASGMRDVRCVVDPPKPPTSIADFPLSCNEPFVYREFGTHTFYAAAVDKAGNLGISEPGVVTIVPVPRVSIERGPDGTVFTTLNTFTFRASVAGSTFRCSLDGSPPKPCTSPWTLPVLKTGSHYIQLFATSPQGFDDPFPPQRSFTVGAQQSTKVDCKIAPLKVGSGKQRCVYLPGGELDGYDCDGANVCKPLPACPVGALCTLALSGTFESRDAAVAWQYSANAVGRAGQLVAKFGSPASCSASNPSPGSCSTSGEWDFMGEGLTSAWCGAERRQPGGTLGDDAKRSLSCNATFKITAAPPLTATVGQSGTAVFVPSAGTLSATPAGGKGARAALVGGDVGAGSPATPGGSGGVTATAARAPKKSSKKKLLFTAKPVQTKAAGNVVLALTLSKAAKATLRKKGKLSVPITLTFKPEDGGAPIVVTKTYLVRPNVKARPLPKPKGE